MFGDYEDAIEPTHDFLYHSAISTTFKHWLINTKDIIQSVLDLTDDVPLNALEGFIRQVIGWREFIRGIYSHYNDEQKIHQLF